MTLGARPGLDRLFRDFGDRVRFVSIYVREAHPGENYPHHASFDQKMRHARQWVNEDSIPWTVAVDNLEGSTHRAYQTVPNSVYLIGRKGTVVFRALWAGQESLIRDKLEALLDADPAGEDPVLGERENLIVPMIHGAIEFDHALTRGGTKSVEDFRRELGDVAYGMQKLLGYLKPYFHRRKVQYVTHTRD